ncbi:hypothetical protein H2198_004861 [Neophaeococcomyces mojaviensis]|uniref:Uncharacterized protein n=1 Tax=Neophaeococcomyces mojaviensis TaxID=3383035 RepID=A0ACC3A7R5_9EURO|nr:hypothetical protein H2198_004861 [Knufia sp. JES_112]
MSYGGGNDDPTDFEGIYPVPGVLPVNSARPRKDPRTNASTAAQAAGVRAFTAQAIAFYFRAPVKAFFRTRVDYLAYARNLQQHNVSVANDATSRRLAWLRSTTPGVIASAVRYYGWRVIPEQILPPLIANVSVGAVLYTSYLQILGHLHEESSKASKRVYPPPTPFETLTAGYLAGSIQSLVAAPLDAIQVRYERYENPKTASGSPQSMWTFGREKLREIGTRGVFAGWGLSFLRDSFGSAIFFSTFEYIKAQGYYNFIHWYYNALNRDVVEELARKRPHQSPPGTQSIRRSSYYAEGSREEIVSKNTTTIKPHYAIEPSFLFLAGISASIAQSVIIYPLHHVQVEHWTHLEELDTQACRLRQTPHLKGRQRWRMMRVYYRAYQETWNQCLHAAANENGGNVWRWLYRGFWWNTIRQLPSTSAGLIIFELVRRKYGMSSDEVRISTQGDYDILVH